MAADVNGQGPAFQVISVRPVFKGALPLGGPDYRMCLVTASTCQHFPDLRSRSPHGGHELDRGVKKHPPVRFNRVRGTEGLVPTR
jgi:hypothetical protein